MRIEPVIAVDHGPTTSFYYEDPDRNSVELFVDDFSNWEQSTDFMWTSKEFQANPFDTLVDPAKLASAYDQGMLLSELLRRAYAGEFEPSVKIEPGTVL
jgi:catechol 2,3-dioxygenase